MPRAARENTTSFLLRDIDEKLWARVKRRAEREEVGLRDVLLSLARAYAAGEELEVRRQEDLRVGPRG